MILDDTIAAVATAPGHGAVALLRVSGRAALEVVGQLVRPWPLEPRRATLCAVHDPRSGALLDRALVTVFAGPSSYTGEDVVELATHGGAVVPASVMAALEAAGARGARAGEFTRRAVLNGRMDLVQAEAVGDLVDARSGAMQRSALEQMDGGLSRRVGALREQLLEVEALLAYDIDFPEEDDGPIPRQRIADAAASVVSQLEALIATVPSGALIRDGAVVVIAGPPNAGKSSLLNALLGENRAIVTDIPGTTRDAIEVMVDSRPWPLRLVDTAGMHAATDIVERLGIEVSERWVSSAQVVLACGEGLDEVQATMTRLRALTSAPLIGVRTKIDLLSASASTATTILDDTPVIGVSAETGAGLPELMETIQRTLTARHVAPTSELPVVTRARHRRALESAHEEATAFLDAWVDDLLPAPVAAVHVRAALGALEELVGGLDVEEVLDRVFASFCVGK